MIPDNPISFGARFEYMSALETHWPEVLRSLRDDTFPTYRTCWERNRKSSTLQNLARLSKASPKARPGGFRKVERSVHRWGKAHGFLDVWILDLAVQSMYHWVYEKNIS